MINRHLDWTNFVLQSEIDWENEFNDFELCDELCEIKCGDDGIELHIFFRKDNGLQTNDPCYESTTAITVTDENGSIIDFDYK